MFLQSALSLAPEVKLPGQELQYLFAWHAVKIVGPVQLLYNINKPVEGAGGVFLQCATLGFSMTVSKYKA